MKFMVKELVICLVFCFFSCKIENLMLIVGDDWEGLMILGIFCVWFMYLVFLCLFFIVYKNIILLIRFKKVIWCIYYVNDMRNNLGSYFINYI